MTTYAPYSFSKLSTYKNCPRKFAYNYILKIPREQCDNEALRKGSAVHSILENYPVSVNKPNIYQDVADRFIRSNLGQNLLNRQSTREYKFGMCLDDSGKFVECNYSKSLFRGFIDYVCVIDNVIHLIDWKTGNYKEERYQDYNQLMFYAVYFFEKYNVDTIEISYVYVEHELHNSMTLTKEFLPNYKNELLSIINTIENDDNFDKNKSKLCDYCDYQEYCENN